MPTMVPQNIRHAILLRITDLFEHRGDTERVLTANTIEDAIENLIYSDRIMEL